jgi:putative ABC transport system permease protein
LVGALLFARSLNNIANVDAGFRIDGILVTDIDFTTLSLTNERRLAFSSELLRQVRAIPGVDSAALAEIVPLSGSSENHDILMGDSGKQTGEEPYAAFNRISPRYFETLQTPILAGRDIDDHDVAGSPLVAVVNETFARKFTKGANPVGVVFRIGRLRHVYGPYQIIGLVRDTKYNELREDSLPIVYVSYAQYDHADTDAQIVIRSNAPFAGLISSVKSIAERAHPGLDITFSPFRKTIENGLLRERLVAELSGFFGALAVLLAAIGLYGVISYMVERRRNEIGIRMALGAGKEEIIRLVLRETAHLLMIGIAIGIVVALFAGKTITAMLFGLKPTDALTYAMAIASLSAIAALASFLPARRAARLDPMVALRNE